MYIAHQQVQFQRKRKMAQIKTLDITPARIQMPVIEVSQFDIGRDVIIHMKDGADWYDLTGLTVKLQGTKPSGFGYSVTGTVDGHDVTFSTIYDMTSESGFILSEVSIIDGTDDSRACIMRVQNGGP